MLLTPIVVMCLECEQDNLLEIKTPQEDMKDQYFFFNYKGRLLTGIKTL